MQGAKGGHRKLQTPYNFIRRWHCRSILFSMLFKYLQIKREAFAFYLKMTRGFSFALELVILWIQPVETWDCLHRGQMLTWHIFHNTSKGKTKKQVQHHTLIATNDLEHKSLSRIPTFVVCMIKAEYIRKEQNKDRNAMTKIIPKMYVKFTQTFVFISYSSTLLMLWCHVDLLLALTLTFCVVLI